MQKRSIIKPSIIVAAVFFALFWFFVFEEDVLGRAVVPGGLAAGVSVSLIFLWFILDSKERSITSSVVLKIAVILLPILAVPYYKFRYVGWVQGIRFIVVFVLLMFGPPMLLGTMLGLEA